MSDMKIIEEDFKDYQRIRESGKTNMFDINIVIQLSNNLNKEKIIYIMKNYSELIFKYGD